MTPYETLGDAIWATQPSWLLAYLMLLVAANLGAVFFVAKRTPMGWRPRYEALAIIVAFLLAGEYWNICISSMAMCGFWGWRISCFGHRSMLGYSPIAKIMATRPISQNSCCFIW